MPTLTVPNPDTRRKLSPPQLAKLWGVDPAKILHWIRTGQLTAINAALEAGGRPRFLVDVADIALFEQRRAAVQPPQPSRRRRRSTPGVTEYFS